MKSKHANSPLSKDFTDGRPSSYSYAVSERLRQSNTRGNPIKHAKIRHIPKEYHPVFGRYRDEDATLQHRDIVHVTKLQGSKAVVAISDENVKRFKVTVIDDVTGLPKEVMARLIMKELKVLCYGTAFYFRRKLKSATAMDSRSGKRVSLDFVKKECARMNVGQAELDTFISDERD